MNEAEAFVEEVVNELCGCNSNSLLVHCLAPSGRTYAKAHEVISAALEQLRSRRDWSGVVKLLLAPVATQVNKFGDGGGRLLFLSAVLLRIGRTLSREHIFARQLHVVRSWICDALRPKMPWVATVSIRQLPAAVFGIANLGFLQQSEEEDDSLRALIVEGFCATATSGDNSVDRLQQLAFFGDVSESRLISGLVIGWQLSLEAQLMLRGDFNKPLRTVVFQCQLDIDTFLSTSLLDVLVLKQIDLVASQRTVCPAVREALFRRRILTFERLSIKHVAGFSSAAGCRICATAAEFAASSAEDCVGLVGGLQPLNIGGSKVTLVLPGKPGAVWTLAIALRNTAHAATLHAEVEKTIQILHRLVKKPEVVGAFGSTEMLLHEYLGLRVFFERRCHMAVSAVRDALRLWMTRHIIGGDPSERHAEFLRWQAAFRSSVKIAEVVSWASDRQPALCEPPTGLQISAPKLCRHWTPASLIGYRSGSLVKVMDSGGDLVGCEPRDCVEAMIDAAMTSAGSIVLVDDVIVRDA